MTFAIIFTKITNNENLKIIVKYGLKSNYQISNFLLHYFINIFFNEICYFNLYILIYFLQQIKLI